jgi:AcrR family transcriptional regulator
MSKNKRTIPPLPAKPQPKSNPLLKANLAKVKLAKVKMPRVKTPRVKIKKTRRRRASDLRIRRTRGRLSNALVELMRDKSIDQITVQQVLQQAAVGRSTFYLHYRDKDDLLLDLMENGMEMWSNGLSKTKEKSHRLVPVEEFFAHAASAMQFYRALIDSGRIHSFFDLAQGCFARGIARRLREIGPPNPVMPNPATPNPATPNPATPNSAIPNLRPKNAVSASQAGRELDARSHAIAGNLLSLLKWWLDRGAKESPRAMDQLFHQIAWNGLK